MFNGAGVAFCGVNAPQKHGALKPERQPGGVAVLYKLQVHAFGVAAVAFGFFSAYS